MMYQDSNGVLVGERDDYTAHDGTLYPSMFPKSEVPGLTPVPDTGFGFENNLALVKSFKRKEINDWCANHAYFEYDGHVVVCDTRARFDMDTVANCILLTGAFPDGFSGSWKDRSNVGIPMANTDAFKRMYAAYAASKMQRYATSQALKAQLDAATTVDQVKALIW